MVACDGIEAPQNRPTGEVRYRLQSGEGRAGEFLTSDRRPDSSALWKGIFGWRENTHSIMPPDLVTDCKGFIEGGDASLIEIHPWMWSIGRLVRGISG